MAKHSQDLSNTCDAGITKMHLLHLPPWNGNNITSRFNMMKDIDENEV